MGLNASKKGTSDEKSGKKSLPFKPAVLGFGRKESTPRTSKVRSKSTGFFPSILPFGRKSSGPKSVGQRGSRPKSVGQIDFRPTGVGQKYSGQKYSGQKSVGTKVSSPKTVSRKDTSKESGDRKGGIPTAKHIRVRGSSAVSTRRVFGRLETTLKARQKHPYDLHTMRKPQVKKGTLWKDKKFPFTIDQDQKETPVKISWKRPTVYSIAQLIV